MRKGLEKMVFSSSGHYQIDYNSYPMTRQSQFTMDGRVAKEKEPGSLMVVLSYFIWTFYYVTDFFFLSKIESAEGIVTDCMDSWSQ